MDRENKRQRRPTTPDELVDVLDYYLAGAKQVQSDRVKQLEIRLSDAQKQGARDREELKQKARLVENLQNGRENDSRRIVLLHDQLQDTTVRCDNLQADLDEMDESYQRAMFETQQEREGNVIAHRDRQQLTLELGRVKAEVGEQKATMAQARKQQLEALRLHEQTTSLTLRRLEDSEKSRETVTGQLQDLQRRFDEQQAELEEARCMTCCQDLKAGYSNCGLKACSKQCEACLQQERRNGRCVFCRAVLSERV